MCKDITKINNDLITLYSRKTSSIIQARFKHPVTKKIIRVSTKTKDLNDAIYEASRIYNDTLNKIKYGVEDSTDSKSFSKISKETISKLELSLNSGNGKKIYSHYITAIKKYIIPFFKSKPIDRINQKDIYDWYQWINGKLNKIPAKSTLLTYNSSLNNVFKTAMEKNLIQPWQLPKLSTKHGREGKIRSYFTKDEIPYLYNKLNHWQFKTKKQKSKELRFLLKYYVKIDINCGCRYGELFDLKWCDIEYIDDTLRLYVDGKTGPRQVVCKSNAITYLDELRKPYEKLKNLSFDELFRVNQYVFSYINGDRVAELDHPFLNFLNTYDLRFGKDKIERTLYSCRHTYITNELLYNENVDIHVLARNCGTSEEQIEKAYSHVKVLDKAYELAGISRKTKEVLNVNKVYPMSSLSNQEKRILKMKFGLPDKMEDIPFIFDKISGEQIINNKIVPRASEDEIKKLLKVIQEENEK